MNTRLHWWGGFVEHCIKWKTCDWEFPTTTNVMPTSFGLIATWLRHLKSYICYYVSEWIHLFFSSPHLEKQRDRIVKVGPKASLYLACVWITKLGFQRWSCWQFYKWINWHPIFQTDAQGLFVFGSSINNKVRTRDYIGEVVLLTIV